jgi:tetratricopeptide (TPR) repeat protein
MVEKIAKTLIEYLSIIDEISRANPKGEFVFRGQGIFCNQDRARQCILKEDDRFCNVTGLKYCVTPGATRRLSEQFPEQAPFTKTHLLKYHETLLRDAKMKGFHKRESSTLSNMELIADLQHFGCATMLIDFTRNPLVSLYFAVSSFPKEDFVIFMMDISDKSKFSNVAFDMIESNDTKAIEIILDKNNDMIYYWEPSSLNKRIPAQHSIFICGTPILPRELFTTIVIKQEGKMRILRDLQELYHISDMTIYDDLAGFAFANSQTKKIFNLSFDENDSITSSFLSVQKEELEKLLLSDSKAIESDKTNCTLYFERALANQSLERYEDALRDYTEAIRLGHREAQTYNNRGLVNFKLEQFEDSQADFDEAIIIDPSFAEAFFNRGNLFELQGKTNEALADFTKTIELEPRYHIAYKKRALIFEKMGIFDKAISDLNKALEINPNNHRAISIRARIHGKMSKHEEALRDYNLAIELDPDNHLYFNGRGILKKQIGVTEEAQKDFEKAFELDCKKPGRYINICDSHHFINNPKKAVEEYSIAIKLDADEPINYINRAIAHKTLGNTQQYQADLAKAKELGELQGKEYILQYLEKHF